jgi:membrane protease YdiL (CAAX protease family)
MYMLNRHRAFRAISGRELRWREVLFWTLLLAAFQSLESMEWRRQTMGVVEAVSFLAVAISSVGELDGLGLEFTGWNPIGFRGVTVSVMVGFLAGGAAVMVALRCHQAIGAASGWNKVALAVILGPVVEEVVFRGYLMAAALHLARRCSRTKRIWLSITGVALIFMLAHGGRPGTTAIQLCCIAATGTLYGIIRVRQQSTVAAVLAHGCYNLALYLAFWGGLSS